MTQHTFLSQVGCVWFWHRYLPDATPHGLPVRMCTQICRVVSLTLLHLLQQEFDSPKTFPGLLFPFHHVYIIYILYIYIYPLPRKLAPQSSKQVHARRVSKFIRHNRVIHQGFVCAAKWNSVQIQSAIGRSGTKRNKTNLAHPWVSHASFWLPFLKQTKRLILWYMNAWNMRILFWILRGNEITSRNHEFSSGEFDF